ncbi:adenylate kinase [Chloroflexota bacterium]
MSFLPRRISVVGTTGSGKTTLARKLFVCLAIPHIELDAIYWGAHWEPLSVVEFRAQTSEALDGNAWVVDGNYSKVRDIVWDRADTVVWLDYPLPQILHQLLQRTFRRVFLREKLWKKNQEGFHSQFLSRDSLLLYAIKPYPKHREMYPKLITKPRYNHLKLVRLQSPKATNKWIQELGSLASFFAT